MKKPPFGRAAGGQFGKGASVPGEGGGRWVFHLPTETGTLGEFKEPGSIQDVTLSSYRRPQAGRRLSPRPGASRRQ